MVESNYILVIENILIIIMSVNFGKRFVWTLTLWYQSGLIPGRFY